MHCKKCGQEKDVNEFYVSNLSTCKSCVRAAVRANRAEKEEYYKAFDKMRAKNPSRVKARKEYSLTPRGKEVHLKANRKFRANNPKKYAAHEVVTIAVASGKLVKPDTCSSCGNLARVQGHHEDYSKPLDVIWLCSACHAKRHRSENTQLATAI